MRGLLLLLPCVCGLIVPVARAEVTTEGIEEVVVVGARLPRPVQDVAGTVDVIMREQLLETLAVDVADVVRYTPGVSVTQSGTRFSNSDITIRGLSGNRVLQLVDGIPIADQFDIGDFSNATQDYLVPDAISRIEILRGPASTLFGSDALGGVVAVVTRDPEEFLEGERVRATTSGSYRGADDARTLNASVAAGAGRWAGVLHASRLDGHEFESAASGTEDALDRTRDAAMAKISYGLGNGDRLRLRADAFDETVDSDLRSVLGYGRRYVNTTSLSGDDERRRWTTAVGYDFERTGTLLQSGRVDVYLASTRVEQRTRELRELAVPPVEIHREFDYEQDVWGVIGDAEGRFDLGTTQHRLGWGLSFDRRRVEEYRDGLETNLQTGISTPVLLGENMPVRDFPISTVSELGLYLHDEIAIGALSLIPGVRFDYYRMDARSDDLFAADNPATAVVDIDESAFSPKLGALYRFSQAVTGFAQYAHGFRAPPFEDVNIGLDIPRFNFRAIPNPDLRSESSDGVEVGVRYTGDAVRVSASVFGAVYDDFIESRINLGPDPDTGTLIFQSRNIAEAKVYGAELKVGVDLDSWLHGVSVDAAANWTRGENDESGEPLNSVDPAEVMVKLAWTPRAAMQLALMTTFVARQDRLDETNVDLFAPDGFVTLDALATLRPMRDVRIDLGVFNVFDETYWRWSAVRNRPADDPMIGALSAPGRYGSVSVQISI